MASIESLGLGSGVLTTDLVDKLMKAEREVSELRLNNRQELVDAKITAYGEIKSLMSKIQSAANSLSSPSLVGSTKVKSSDESILSATGSATADPGTYNVQVLNTAKAHTLATSANATYNSLDEIVGTGKLVFTFGKLNYDVGGNISGQEINPDRASKTLTIDESNRTLSGIRDAINNAKMGVTASIINDGTGYRLLMTSTETGEQNAMRIEAQDTDGNLVTGGLAALAYNETQNGGGNLTQTSAGADAKLLVNGLEIRRSSNNIDEVVKGVTLNLKNADAGKNISIEVTADTELLTKTIQGFVESYNDLKGFVDSLSSFDSSKNQGGLLMGDSAVRSMMSQIRSLISQPIVGLNGKYHALTDLGVNSNTNNKNLLDFDVDKLTKAVNEDRSNLIGLLAKTGITSDSQIIYVNDSINTKPGKYDVVITQLATQAKYEGGALDILGFSAPVVIDSSNNNFTINVNGQFASVELTQGSYSSGAELAKQLAMQINSHENIAKFGHSVSVDYDATKKNFSFTSNKYGSESQIYFSAVDANTANTLGFNTLGAGTHQGIGLTTLNAEAFQGKGSTTAAASQSVAENKGINFATSNATFELIITGAAGTQSAVVNVTANAVGNDLNGDGVFGDRKDTLQAIQSAIDATSLNGKVVASFDKNGHLQFQTTEVGTATSIQINSVGNNTSDVLLGLEPTTAAVANGKNPGLTLGSNVEFNVQVDGVTSAQKVSIPAGTYLSGNDLATAIQTQLNNPALFPTATRGAETAKGSRDITGLDFSAANAGFRLNVGGQIKEIVVNGNDADPLVNIQAALDAAYGPNKVTAALDGTGLKLSTVATGHEQYIEVLSDGRGARVGGAGADLSQGIDFNATPANFRLTVDGVNIDVNVNTNATLGSNDSASNLRAVQQALDSALASSGSFAAGDIKAALDENGQLVFETVSKNGVRTAATFGANAAIQISNANIEASDFLGLSNSAATNGYDGFGLTTNARTFGYDVNAEVKYVLDPETKLGSFEISMGGRGTKVGFTDLDSAAIAFLGLQDASSHSAEIPRGKDVAGTINGVEASGQGQFLRATDGTIKATNGYYLGNAAADFSTPVVLNADNNTFSISVDGVNAEISLSYPATYNSGASLASALQAAINNHADFKSKDIAVKVEFTNDPTSYAHNKFGIISASTGAKSEVKLTNVPPGAAAVFGFVSGYGDGEKGKDQVGSTDPSSGLRVKVTGGNLGARGSLTYVSGFGDLLKDIMDGFLNGKNSLMTTREGAFERETENLTKDREKLENRLAAHEARLKSQFAYNDAIVASLNTTLDYVKQQFEAMNNANKK